MMSWTVCQLTTKKMELSLSLFIYFFGVTNHHHDCKIYKREKENEIITIYFFTSFSSFRLLEFHICWDKPLIRFNFSVSSFAKVLLSNTFCKNFGLFSVTFKVSFKCFWVAIVACGVLNVCFFAAWYSFEILSCSDNDFSFMHKSI